MNVYLSLYQLLAVVGAGRFRSAIWDRRPVVGASGATSSTRVDGVASPTECVLLCGMSYAHAHCSTVTYGNGSCWMYGASTGIAAEHWTREEGWMPIFRVTAGAGLDVWGSWLSDVYDPSTSDGLTAEYFDVGGWSALSEVKLSMFVGDVEVMYTTFDVTSSTRQDFFTQSRIVDSSFGDIRTATISISNPVYYSAYGAVLPGMSVARRFYAPWYHSGCGNDNGWFFVMTDTGTCSYETSVTAPLPVLFYCPGTTGCNHVDKLHADSFLIVGRAP